MFKNIAISKKFIIPLLFICLLVIALNTNIGDVSARDINESNDNYEISAIDEDKLENSQENNINNINNTTINCFFMISILLLIIYFVLFLRVN